MVKWRFMQVKEDQKEDLDETQLEYWEEHEEYKSLYLLQCTCIHTIHTLCNTITPKLDNGYSITVLSSGPHNVRHFSHENIVKRYTFTIYIEMLFLHYLYKNENCAVCLGTVCRYFQMAINVQYWMKTSSATQDCIV